MNLNPPPPLLFKDPAVFSWNLVLTASHLSLRLLLVCHLSWSWVHFTSASESVSHKDFISGVGWEDGFLDKTWDSGHRQFSLWHNAVCACACVCAHGNLIQDKLISTSDSCFHSDTINWSLESIIGDKMAGITNVGWEWAPFLKIIVIKSPRTSCLAGLEFSRYFF